MRTTLYTRLVLYFTGLLMTTLLAVTLLCFGTVGRAATRDFHALIRNHVQTLGLLTKAMLEKAPEVDQIQAFTGEMAGRYDLGMALFDHHQNLICGSPEPVAAALRLEPGVFEIVDENGIFVQPAHYGKPAVYLIAVTVNPAAPRYLYITKSFSSLMAFGPFWMGLLLIAVVFTLAIYPLSKGITRPITELTQRLGLMASGHFNQTIEVKRTDELGTLLTVFQQMSDTVRTTIDLNRMLLADISHELRSPMARLRLGAELSGESLPHDAAAAAKYLQAMGSEIEHMDQLLGELLDYSKINLPNFSLRLNPIDPHTVLEDIYNRYLPVAASKGIELDCLADAPSETLSVDRFRITQVMNNLMDNALHYSAPKAKVTVTCQKQPDGICFRVMDEGPGVPEPLRQKVFDPLFRADPSRSRASGGLGLGLAIAKKIVELHGGRIYCEARHGRTIFAFCIPSRPS